MVNQFSILIGKILIYLSKNFNLGSGSTWPGHIALKLNPNFNKEILMKASAKKIVIAGTNGKTTTGKLILNVLEANDKKVAHNDAGANLQNGLASSLIKFSDLSGNLNKDYLIFESDEYALPQVLKEIEPDYLICLNLFRDQLDRYGELDSIAKKWKESIAGLKKTTLILNADDPLVSYLGNKNTLYFGLDESGGTEVKHGADSMFCPKCSAKLEYKTVVFSHLGDWQCPGCKLRRPKISLSEFSFYPLSGIYNKYNVLASVLFLQKEGFPKDKIVKGLKKFKPAFGRQEEINYKAKQVVLYLSKNPTSLNESLSTVKGLGAKNILFVLNDRIPDGLDVSWIWDIDLENLLDKDMNIAVSGDRVYDMALRVKYAGFYCHIEEDLESVINHMIGNLEEKEKLFVLPNYSAMLETRKILLGRKLL